MPRSSSTATPLGLSTVPPLPVDPLLGTVLDRRFLIEERIGSGGFGVIYRARDVMEDREVALKLMLPDVARHRSNAASLRREGELMMSLRDPHTVAAYEVGSAGGHVFIVMELLRGESLFVRLLRGRVDWKHVVKIAEQICSSLADAHLVGVIHCDLKPTNIYLERRGNDPTFAKLLDFGVANVVRCGQRAKVVSPEAVGTLEYMSPEQMRGEPVTEQTDIYSLGVIIYEAITGRRPFPECKDPVAVHADRLALRVVPLRWRAPVPAALERIVMRCLAPDRQKRYASIADLRTDLEQLRTGYATQLVDDPPPTPANDRAARSELVTEPIANTEVVRWSRRPRGTLAPAFWPMTARETTIRRLVWGITVVLITLILLGAHAAHAGPATGLTQSPPGDARP